MVSASVVGAQFSCPVEFLEHFEGSCALLWWTCPWVHRLLQRRPPACSCRPRSLRCEAIHAQRRCLPGVPLSDLTQVEPQPGSQQPLLPVRSLLVTARTFSSCSLHSNSSKSLSPLLLSLPEILEAASEGAAKGEMTDQPCVACLYFLEKCFLILVKYTTELMISATLLLQSVASSVFMLSAADLQSLVILWN